MATSVRFKLDSLRVENTVRDFLPKGFLNFGLDHSSETDPSPSRPIRHFTNHAENVLGAGKPMGYAITMR